MDVISVVSPCYNEEGNVRELYERVKSVMGTVEGCQYEHIFIDNSSSDHTLDVLRSIAVVDKNVKVIANSRNFGHIRSPMHAVHQAVGDAVVTMASDLQDPPELILDMIREWKKGIPVVIAVKKSSQEPGLMFWIRTRYYRLVNRLSNIETYEHFTGFGLYDRKVIDIIKQFDDPYPYFRGMIAEIGLPHAEIPFNQPLRTRGLTKNNFYTLYDMAMLGITNLSKVPLRLVTFAGFAGSLVCITVASIYLFYKLFFWRNFSLGVAPIVIGLFFLGSLQLLFMGILGEYIGAIHTYVQHRPLVLERERINFEYGPGVPQETKLLDSYSKS